MKQRQTNGQYKKIPFLHSDFTGLKLMIATVAIGAGIEWLYTPMQEPISPLGAPIVVRASEPTPQPTTEPHAEKKNLIRELFGDDAEKMITIIGTCENGTWDQTRTNTNRNETKDWGLAQINDANSKLCTGLDFKHDWQDNLKCAHRVYKSQGLSAWACSHTVNIPPFYMRSK